MILRNRLFHFALFLFSFASSVATPPMCARLRQCPTVDHGRSFERERARRSVDDEANRGASRAAELAVQGPRRCDLLERRRHAVASAIGKGKGKDTFEGGGASLLEGPSCRLFFSCIFFPFCSLLYFVCVHRAALPQCLTLNVCGILCIPLLHYNRLLRQ